MRTTIGKALLRAVNDASKGTTNAQRLKELAHANRWLGGTTLEYSGAPDFKIVIRAHREGGFRVVLAYGVCGYSAADANVLVETRVFL